jgi:hypothetical protein
MYGTRNPNSATPFSTPNPVGGLYGAGRFTYSTNQFSGSATTVVTAAAIGASSVATASWANVYYDSSLSASVAGARFEIKAITVPTSSIPSFDVDAIRGFVITSGSITAAQNLPAFTQLDLASGQITFFVTASSTAIVNSGTYVVFYNKATADNARGEFEDTPAVSTSVPNSLSGTTNSI